MIDWARVGELREEVGAEDFDEVVEIFLEEAEETLTPLRKNPICNTPGPVLHFLKGMSGNLGFQPVRKICETLEKTHDEGPMDLSTVVIAYDKTCDAFMLGLPKQSWAI